jgi:hypothetical protein
LGRLAHYQVRAFASTGRARIGTTAWAIVEAQGGFTPPVDGPNPVRLFLDSPLHPG